MYFLVIWIEILTKVPIFALKHTKYAPKIDGNCTLFTTQHARRHSD